MIRHPCPRLCAMRHVAMPWTFTGHPVRIRLAPVARRKHLISFHPGLRPPTFHSTSDSPVAASGLAQQQYLGVGIISSHRQTYSQAVQTWPIPPIPLIPAMQDQCGKTHAIHATDAGPRLVPAIAQALPRILPVLAYQRAPRSMHPGVCAFNRMTAVGSLPLRHRDALTG